MKAFFIQCDIYFHTLIDQFNDESDKVAFAIGLLRGAAREWAEPYLRDWIDNRVCEQRMDTRTMFGSFAGFNSA